MIKITSVYVTTPEGFYHKYIYVFICPQHLVLKSLSILSFHFDQNACLVEFKTGKIQAHKSGFPTSAAL